MKPQTKTVLDALQSGKDLTTKEARDLGIKCLSARICELRNEGYPVYTTGPWKKSIYRLGPSRNMVAIAYSTFGGSIFR